MVAYVDVPLALYAVKQQLLAAVYLVNGYLRLKLERCKGLWHKGGAADGNAQLLTSRSVLHIKVQVGYALGKVGYSDNVLVRFGGKSQHEIKLYFIPAAIERLSGTSEDIILCNSNEYRFVEIDDAYSTGSSIMPQKKNPDIAELVRGKTGRVYGALTSILTTMKGIPLAYNKDMQEDKELTFDAIDTVKGCIALFTGMVSTMEFRKDVMEASAKNGFTNATDAADYLVNHGVPFRDAHGIVGRLVLTCIDKGISLDELPLEEYKEISPVFEQDIYEAISMKTCVEKRETYGAPGPKVMEQIIALNREYLKNN